MNGRNDEIERIEREASNTEILEFEHAVTQEQVRKQIKECEGKHSQQVVYSTFHDALTQICYGCKKVRSNRRFL